MFSSTGRISFSIIWGFTIPPSPNVDAPIINEYKLTLECIGTAWGSGKTIQEREVK